MFGREGNSKELLGEGGREDLTEPHFKNKKHKKPKKKKKKEKICDWLVDKYQYILAHVTAQACSSRYVCARVFMCIRVHLSLSLCVCLCPRPDFPESCVADRGCRLAGRPSALDFCFLFETLENTQAPGATATKATPWGCVEMDRVLF